MTTGRIHNLHREQHLPITPHVWEFDSSSLIITQSQTKIQCFNNCDVDGREGLSRHLMIIYKLLNVLINVNF